MTDLQDCLTQRKIGKIISIDDENALPSIDTIDELVDAVSAAKSSHLKILAKRDPRFAAIRDKCIGMVNTDPEERRAILRTDLEALVETHKLGASDYAQVAQVFFANRKGDTTKKLLSVFPAGYLQAVSFQEWERGRADFLREAAANSRLLLLVDERNEHEKAVTDVDGKQLIVQLWSASPQLMQYVDTIIVTASCQPNEEFDASRKLLIDVKSEIADVDIRTKVRRAFVISKTRLNGDSLGKQFCIHLHRITATDLQIELAKLAGEALRRALGESLDWLEQIPLSEFHGSVFLSSQNEGAAEIDTLLRLLAIRQRAVLEKELGSQNNSPFKAKIVEMRRFSQKHIDGDYETASHAELRELRQQEFERSGEVLNPLFTPLSSGDVFHWTQAHEDRSEDRWAILLANPCDLMIRKDGRRKARRGWLVPFTRALKGDLSRHVTESRGAAGAERLYVLETGNGDHDVIYLCQNSKVDAVDLDILDLCWTNDGGHLVLDPAAAANLHPLLLPSQQKRLVQLARKARAKGFRNQELFGNEVSVTTQNVASQKLGDVSLDQRVTYPMHRVFQLTAEFAAAALLSLSQSISRPAFGHDYLRAEG